IAAPRRGASATARYGARGSGPGGSSAGLGGGARGTGRSRGSASSAFALAAAFGTLASALGALAALLLLGLLGIGLAAVVGDVEARALEQDARPSGGNANGASPALGAALDRLVLDAVEELELMTALLATVLVRGHVRLGLEENFTETLHRDGQLLDRGRERDSHAAVVTEGGAGHHRDARLVEQQVGEIARRLDALAFELTGAVGRAVGERIEGAGWPPVRDARDRIELAAHEVAAADQGLAHVLPFREELGIAVEGQPQRRLGRGLRDAARVAARVALERHH